MYFAECNADSFLLSWLWATVIMYNIKEIAAINHKILGTNLLPQFTCNLFRNILVFCVYLLESKAHF